MTKGRFWRANQVQIELLERRKKDLNVIELGNCKEREAKRIVLTKREESLIEKKREREREEERAE